MMQKLILLLLVVIFNTVRAQDNIDSADLVKSNDAYGDVFQKEDDEYIGMHINNVNPHAVRYVMREYKNAENIRWVIGKSFTTAEFHDGDAGLLLNFDRNGNLVSTRKTYSKKALDPFLAGYAEKNAGKDYNIHLVTEFIKKGRTTYEISLQNDTHWCFITVRGSNTLGYNRPENIRFMKKG